MVIDPKRSCESPFIPLPISSDKKQPDDALIAPFFQKVEILISGKADAPGSECDCGVIPEVGGIAFVVRESDGSRWFKAIDNSDVVV